MKRRMFLRLLTVIVTLFVFTAVSHAATSNTIDSGDLGNGFTWTVTDEGSDEFENEYELYTLTINGKGVMPDYSKGVKQPWHKYYNNIRRVVVGPGVTGIGDYAFSDIRFLTQLDISKDVATIGDYAFSYSGGIYGTKIKWSKKIRSIGDHAFDMYDINCKTLVLPDGLETIGNYAFYEATSITGLVLPASIKKIGKGLIKNDITGLDRIKFKGTKKQLYKVDMPKSGSMHLLKLPVYCSNGKTYFRNNFKSIKVTVKKELVYNGKIQKPKVTVKNALGKVLKKGRDYTVVYQKSKKPEKYIVTVKPVKSSVYMGGSRTASYKIIPRTIKFTGKQWSREGYPILLWKDNNKKVDGQIVQWSKTKSFKKKKTYRSWISLAGYGDFSGVKHGGSFYVRVRNYVEIGDGSTLYSKWKVKKARRR